VSTVPILCYHGIGTSYPKAEQAFAFSRDTFADHLALFARRGLRTVTIAEIAAARRRGDHAALDNTVALTFDDGYADLATAVLPLLAEHDMVATAFVTTSHVAGRDTEPVTNARWLSSPQLGQLAASGRFEIGGHSHDHLPLDELAPSTITSQLDRCRDELATRLGAAPTSFAYPYGYSTSAVRRLTRAAGWTAAVGVKHARSGPDDDLFDLARIRILGRHDLAALGGFLDGRRVRLGPCREELRTRLYRPLRRLRARVRPPVLS